MTHHSHRKPPMYGIPEHPAHMFGKHSLNLAAVVNHDLDKLGHRSDGVIKRIHKNSIHRHHR